jgi:acyl dehydratase
MELRPMTRHEPSAQQTLRGFASFSPGEHGTLGSVEITRDEVIEFATAWDPQPFHLDEEAGRASLLGGHAASGWHTASLLMRLIATDLLAGAKSMGSGGVRDLKWRRPAMVGDRLTGAYTVTAVRPSSRGDRGYVDVDFTLSNEAGEVVTAFTSTVIMGA